MRLVLVDSYDSFTHNLVQAFRTLGVEVVIVLADQVDVGGLHSLDPDALVFGPGPGRPEHSGCLVPAIAHFAGRVPLLGVCLGHQGIGLAFGGRVIRHEVVHGHATPVLHSGEGLFHGLPAGVPMTRYHSLVVCPETLPPQLQITAHSPDGAIMGLRHRSLPVFGVQFHPESVLSAQPGQHLLANFLRQSASTWTRPGRSPRATA